jgi:hypothetical protein
VGSGEEYRRFAGECLLLAEQLKDPSSKAALMSMATAWQRLAEFVERPAILTLKVPEGGDHS